MIINWESHEALQATIGKDTPKVALALHQSEILVRKWKERPVTDEDFQQSGARNPLDRLVIIIETIEKLDPKRAYVPINWLCVRFGFLPPVKVPKGVVDEKRLVKAILEWNKKFGQMCECISKALADGQISPTEYKRCYQVALEGVQALLNLLNLMKGQTE